MAGTRRTRGRPSADDEPLAMLPPLKRKSKARVGEKRRVIDLMSDDETLAPTKQEDFNVNEEDLENLKIASTSGMKSDPGTVKVEADEGSKATVDANDHVDSKTLQNDVDNSMHEVNNGEESEAEVPVPKRKIAKRATIQSTVPNDIIDSDWEEEFLMTNPNSIYAINLRQIFNSAAWDKISDEDKKYLMKHLPECDKVYEVSEDVTDPTPPKAQLVDGFWNNSQLIARINQVEYDLGEGKYTAKTQKIVEEARKLAQSTEFDTFKENKFEAFWGQKQRVDYNAVAGDTTNVKLETLAKHSALRVGDVFSLRRSFQTATGGSSKKGKKAASILVEKDAKLIAIDPEDFSLTFSYPPGRLQVSIDGKPDKIISGVVSITALETLLCREDGRPPAKLPNGNAFKTFRIKRNEQDIGSLFDVRMEFHSKYLSPQA
ncbi:Asx homology domain-containing protein [Morchella snyderi]|nr:Asx homology domain-containing protein [Morchella snyderi]